jgi:nicotinamidase-related amidase
LEPFEYGTWGGEFRAEFAPQPGDIVAQEHWCSSGFANTDLDMSFSAAWLSRFDRVYTTAVELVSEAKSRARTAACAACFAGEIACV